MPGPHGSSPGLTRHLLASLNTKSPGQYVQDTLDQKQPERLLKGWRKRLLGITASRRKTVWGRACEAPGRSQAAGERPAQEAALPRRLWLLR